MPSDVKKIRNSLGLTTSELAKVCGVNIKTVERWENGESKVTGASAVLLSLLYSDSQLLNKLVVATKPFELRVKCYKKDVIPNLVCVIDVNEVDRFVKVTNYTSRVENLPFGENTKPTYEQYDEFIRSLCTKKKGKGIIINPIDELKATGGNGIYTIVIEE